MPPKKHIPPDFQTPTAAEMRRLWRSYDDEALHRVLLECARLRQVIELDTLREVTVRAWKDAVPNGGLPASLYQMRVQLGDEKRRAGNFGPD